MRSREWRRKLRSKRLRIKAGEEEMEAKNALENYHMRNTTKKDEKFSGKCNSIDEQETEKAIDDAI